MAVDKKTLLADPEIKKEIAKADALTIDELVKDVLWFTQKAEAAEIAATVCKEALMPKVYALGDTKYQNALASVSIQTRKNPDRIDRTKLIAAGVDPDLIDACTIPGGESDPFVTVRAAKVKVS